MTTIKDKLAKSETFMAMEQAVVRTGVSSLGFTATYFAIKSSLKYFSKFFAAIPEKYQSEIVQILVSLLHDAYATVNGPILVQKSLQGDRVVAFDSVASTSLGFYLYDFVLSASQGGKNYQLLEHGLVNIPWTAYALFSGYGRFYHNSLTVSRCSNLASNVFMVFDKTGRLSNSPTTRSGLKTLHILLSFLIKAGFTPYMTSHFLKNSLNSVNGKTMFVLFMFLLSNSFNIVALSSILKQFSK